MTVNVETSAACLILYRMADNVTMRGRLIIFRAISHITGLPPSFVARAWETTR